MFNSRTVVIVGAGASNEIGLPTGNELRETIIKKVRPHREAHLFRFGDEELFDALRRHLGCSKEILIDVGRKIDAGIYAKNSIDEFLEWNSDDQMLAAVGKAAIAKSIVEAEANSLTKFFGGDDGEFRHDRVLNKWYLKFFKELMGGQIKAKCDDPFHNITFIVFNYDRCLQYFLWKSLQTLGFSATQAIAFCSAPDLFLHPYGFLGDLHGAAGLPFGAQRTWYDVNALAGRIQTYGEDLRQGETILKIKTAMTQAETALFLGFYYNVQNMRLLRPNNPTQLTRIFGTAFGRSSSDLETIRWELSQFLAPKWRTIVANESGRLRHHIFVDDAKCSDLFDMHSAYLSRPLQHRGY